MIAAVGAWREETPRLTQLVPDTGCGRARHWACHIEGQTGADSLTAGLEAAGLQRCCDHPALGVFRHARGHEIAWVRATGRIQIRVDVDVPRNERPAMAERLYRRLASALHPASPAQSRPAKEA